MNPTSIDNRRHPDPENLGANKFLEDEQRNRYAPLYEVRFRDGRKPVHGAISSVEPRLGYFLFLERDGRDQIGMVGHNGVRYEFTECQGVFEEDAQSPGYFGGDDLIALWKIKAGVM